MGRHSPPRRSGSADADSAVLSPRVGATALAALFVAALTLRPPIVGLGPLLPMLQADLRMSHGVAGLVATIPVLCQGLLAPVAAVVAARIGTRRAVGACLAALALFSLARATSSGTLALLTWTLLLGIGLGIAGAILPIAVKERFPHRPATATGVYAAGIQFGAAASAMAAVPLAARWHGWRGPLVVFALAAVVSAATWMIAVPAATARRPAHHAIQLPWRSSTAWLLAAVFGLQAVPYYGLNAWLPAWLQDGGWAADRTGVVLAVLNIAALVATLTIPRLADRWGSRRGYLQIAGSSYTAAMVVLLVMPSTAYVSAAVIGLALGVLFALSLTLPLDVATTPQHVGAAAGLMLGVGYSIAAVAPFLLGAVRDATDSFTSGLWVLVGVGAATLALTRSLSPARLQRGL